jgi:hypothetical protein
VPPTSLLPWLADSLNLAVKVGRFVYGVFLFVCVSALARVTDLWAARAPFFLLQIRSQPLGVKSRLGGCLTSGYEIAFDIGGAFRVEFSFLSTLFVLFFHI